MNAHQRGLIAVHRIDRFDADHPTFRTAGALKLFFKIGQIVVGKTQQGTGGKPRTIVARRVTHAVENDHVLGPRCERHQRRKVGLKAGAGHQGFFATKPMSQTFFKAAMTAQAACKQARRTRASAVRTQRAGSGVLDRAAIGGT